MAFLSVNRQFRTTADFRAWLGTLARPTWPAGSCIHNTYKPTEAQWIGLPSMQAMQRAYEAKGWVTGPHLYIAVGSPKPANDGIWAMSPPTVQGTHAGQCNVDHFGIETVGDFHANPPSLPQQQLLIDAIVALHKWSGLPANINAHRDCMAGRTCPGDAFYAILPSIRQRVHDRLALAGKYIVRHTQAIFEAPRPDSPVALNDTAQLIEGQAIDIDEIKLGWCHLSSGLGFVPAGILTKL